MSNVKKDPETDGYERDRSLRSEKLKRNELTITKTRKNETRENRKQIQMCVKSVHKGYQCLWRVREKEKSFEVGKKC